MVNNEIQQTTMKDVTRELRDIVADFTAKARAMPDAEFSAKPLPHKWSRKEVMGHLIDSAQNNLRRFICGQYELVPPRIFYQQDFWVSSNHYQCMDQADVIELWRLINLRICAVLDNMPEANYSKQCFTDTLHSLLWFAEDYVKHMKHHLNQVEPGSFDIVYN